MKTIHDRPAVVESREQLGHWEGDLTTGAGLGSAIATLLERKSRLTLLFAPLRDRHTAPQVGDALIATFAKLPPTMRGLRLGRQSSKRGRPPMTLSWCHEW